VVKSECKSEGPCGPPEISLPRLSTTVHFGCPEFVGSVPAVPLFLIRHAIAGVRNNLDPHDDRRELDPIGWEQAHAIANYHGSQEIEAVYASPALRCRQTVTPLAERLEMEVTLAPELFEGAAPSTSIEFVRSFVGRTVAMCSHADVIPDVLRCLEIGGSKMYGSGCAKGSVWELDNSTERIESGRYFDPSSLAS